MLYRWLGELFSAYHKRALLNDAFICGESDGMFSKSKLMVLTPSR